MMFNNELLKDIVRDTLECSKVYDLTKFRVTETIGNFFRKFQMKN